MRGARSKGGQTRRKPWGGQLVSVSDLMAGLLFIFILLVVAYAFELNVATAKRKEVVSDITNSFEVRRGILSEITREMRERGIQVTVDPDHGILRIPEKVLFPSGSATITDSGRVAITTLSDVLAKVLPCYAGSPEDMLPPGCDHQQYLGKIEAIFVEGHTDSVPLRTTSPFEDNWELATQRALESYHELMLQQPVLDSLRNSRGEPLFSVSGYADCRPVGGERNLNETVEGRAQNRRIDMRFIMTPPKASPEVVREVNRRLASQGKGAASPEHAEP